MPCAPRTIEEFRELIGHDSFDLLAQHLRILEKKEKIYLSGSLVNGFGNRGSDIDVLLISEGGQSLHPDRCYSMRLQRYIDIQTIPLSTVQAFLNDNDGAILERYDTFWLPRSYLDYGQLERLHRFRISLPLSGNEQYGAHKLALGSVLPHYLAVSFYRDAVGYWTDMIGAAMSSDYGQMLEIAALIGRCLAGAATALAGETATHEKWLAKKIQRAGPPFGSLAYRARTLERLALAKGAGSANVADEVAELMLALSAQLAGVDDVVNPTTGPFERFQCAPNGMMRRVTIEHHEAVNVVE